MNWLGKYVVVGPALALGSFIQVMYLFFLQQYPVKPSMIAIIVYILLSLLLMGLFVLVFQVYRQDTLFIFVQVVLLGVLVVISGWQLFFFLSQFEMSLSSVVQFLTVVTLLVSFLVGLASYFSEKQRKVGLFY
ncbi:hypothetical protein Q73_13825 [Bacillus coahuilensis m2-6]|uniref:hypothetical protein n=1 Tax=Bacillus coahuilensis TaxID=408580 RepID=UPI0007504173|nr:hypothetical protein [Bacillus coahuilensis]KUP05067.1 hypothetical protein Q73_13825 [Bacillus coahuilensis m2-6]